MKITDYINSIIEKGKILGLNIDIENPKTIQDKIQWLKIYNNIPLKTKCADKILVHDYVKETLGIDICVPIIKVYDSPYSIDFNTLPNQFVLKCNHGWNMNIVVQDKSKLNILEAKNQLNKWLNTNFGKISGEYQYSFINPKCYSEKYLSDNDKGLTDYKFWCFNGEPKLCNLYCKNGNNYYDLDFNILDISNKAAPADFNKIYKKPKNFEKMKEYAKILSQPFAFVRIDFYEVDDILYLGEMTFTPGNGFMIYEKYGSSLMLGDMLDLSKIGFIKWTDPDIDRKFGDMIGL